MRSHPAACLGLALLLSVPLSLLAPALAQAPAPAAAAPANSAPVAGGGAGRGGVATGVVSPEVAADRRVTFRMFAPKATEVSVSGQWDDNQRHAMTKDDRGVWSVTLGPI